MKIASTSKAAVRMLGPERIDVEQAAPLQVADPASRGTRPEVALMTTDGRFAEPGTTEEIFRVTMRKKE